MRKKPAELVVCIASAVVPHGRFDPAGGTILQFSNCQWCCAPAVRIPMPGAEAIVTLSRVRWRLIRRSIPLRSYT